MYVTSPSDCTAGACPLLRLRLRATALSLVTAGFLLALQGCSDAKGIADEQAAAKESEKTLLVYTDNTPGIRVMAFAMHQALRLNGFATVVTTDEAEFIRLLPTRRWANVLVTTRFESTKPAYLNPLRAYMQTGGITQIYTWLDNPKAPARPGSVVSAPLAMQLWIRGMGSANSYMGGENMPEEEQGKTIHNAAYVLYDFKDVAPEPLSNEDDPICAPLKPGAYEPLDNKAQAFSL